MPKRKARAIVVVAILILLMALYVIWTASSSRADGPPSDDPVVTDPCFRQDPECYDQQEVECADNVFVPLNLDGTWTCPGEQLPEEQIGRAIDCPDGTVGYVIDIHGTVRCPNDPVIPGPDQVSRGGSHPFLQWSIIFEILRFLFAYN